MGGERKRSSTPCGLSRGRIASDLFRRGHSPVRITLALTLLSDRGLVRSQHQAGMSRSYEMWFAAEGGAP